MYNAVLKCVSETIRQMIYFVYTSLAHIFSNKILRFVGSSSTDKLDDLSNEGIAQCYKSSHQ